MAIKTFTAGSVLTASDTNTFLANAGLVYVNETIFSGSGTPFINGCFTSSYKNYRVIMNLSTSNSTNVRIRFRFGTNTPDVASVYDRYGFFVAGGTLTNSTSTGETSYYFVSTTAGTTDIASVAMDVFSPNAAEKTVVQSQSWNTNTGGLMFLNCRMNNTTQYTGIEITADAGTLTGSMRVYGYRQA